MMELMDTQLKKLLGFSQHEAKIWKSLETDSYNISELATLTKFPRTTLYTALASLKKRGFITTHAKGRSVIVSPLPERDMSLLLTQGALSFTKGGNMRIAHKEKNNSGFTVIYGKNAMLKVWESLAERKTKRVYAIQPSRSLLNTIKLFKPGEFIPLNTAIKKNKVIVDAIMREDGLPTYLNFHKDNPKIQKEILESFAGRMADTTLVKNSYLNNNAELLVTPRSAFLMNWENQVGIEIENKDMIELLKELFELAKGYGKKIDFNEYIKNYLEKTP